MCCTLAEDTLGYKKTIVCSQDIFIWNTSVIISRRYTGDDFMFFYLFVSRRRPHKFVHGNTFDQFLDFFNFWNDCWPWPIDYLIRFCSIFVVILTLNFKGKMWNLLYLSQKWYYCHRMKSKHIEWTLGLKRDHRVGPWPWPWPWIFKVKYGIYCISTKSGPIAKHNDWNPGLEGDQWVWLWPWLWPLNFQGPIWPWPLTTRIALTRVFLGQALK